ncbi:LacI family DNA-binding transcriptional regulator [Jiangella asiatica]|uniref:LacI family transcriptional regulator n=1 Tax=Jiangella asiatica TaxID=2530372 RepID=A0A4R5DA27_9ACTN|nr:LacI family DNA-binding transcriptional regulator [Jiangella asiatica]TDE08621.1 LacI family transcriptional regulator [Jiangella asiatica]
MTVTRRDVARLAGTSPAVVSYVLNGGPRGVAPRTRERVLAAVEQLGYRPNQLAASLRTSRTMTLGLVVPDNANPFFAELARAVEDAAFSAGYTLLLGNATDDEARQTAYVRTFIDRRVDGLLLIPSHGAPACLPDINRSGTPWVVLDRRTEAAVFAAQILVDNRGGAAAATAHLLEHGRRRVACIAGPGDVAVTSDRVSGWRDAMTAAGMSPDRLLLRHTAFGRFAGYEAARDLLATENVDAIFVASDEQAAGVLRAIGEAGRRCPDDVAVVSFDGVEAAEYTTPALTTMRQPLGELARIAIEQLIAQMEDPDLPPQTTVLPVSLLRRGSCGCPDPPGGAVGAGSGSTDDDEEERR